MESPAVWVAADSVRWLLLRPLLRPLLSAAAPKAAPSRIRVGGQVQAANLAETSEAALSAPCEAGAHSRSRPLYRRHRQGRHHSESDPWSVAIPYLLQPLKKR